MTVTNGIHKIKNANSNVTITKNGKVEIVLQNRHNRKVQHSGKLKMIVVVVVLDTIPKIINVSHAQREPTK